MKRVKQFNESDYLMELGEQTIYVDGWIDDTCFRQKQTLTIKSKSITEPTQSPNNYLNSAKIFCSKKRKSQHTHPSKSLENQNNFIKIVKKQFNFQKQSSLQRQSKKQKDIIQDLHFPKISIKIKSKNKVISQQSKDHIVFLRSKCNSINLYDASIHELKFTEFLSKRQSKIHNIFNHLKNVNEKPSEKRESNKKLNSLFEKQEINLKKSKLKWNIFPNNCRGRGQKIYGDRLQVFSSINPTYLKN